MSQPNLWGSHIATFATESDRRFLNRRATSWSGLESVINHQWVMWVMSHVNELSIKEIRIIHWENDEQWKTHNDYDLWFMILILIAFPNQTENRFQICTASKISKRSSQLGQDRPPWALGRKVWRHLFLAWKQNNSVQCQSQSLKWSKSESGSRSFLFNVQPKGMQCCSFDRCIQILLLLLMIHAKDCEISVLKTIDLWQSVSSHMHIWIVM